MFTKKQYDEYSEYLKVVCGLSNLFSDSKTPFLHYRLAENLFCKAFEAENLARADIAYDAKLGNIGFGIKTFICPNNSSLEKVAEFNRNSSELRKLNDDEVVNKISNYRNERIDFASRTYNISEKFYHCITRRQNKIIIFNTPYHKIDISSIKIIKSSTKSIIFNDKYNEYNFNYSKTTLLKKFYIPKNKRHEIDVDIIENPLDIILGIFQNSIKELSIEDKNLDYVILPLYSPKNKIVPEKSGLNQWNAGGRRRSYGEVYIPVPMFIHKNYENFFPPRYEHFNLVLPTLEKLSATLCQDGAKALMTNPNRALADWLLKHVLNLGENELLKYEHLSKLGIDSVKITKIDNENYKIDFAKLGSYETFEQQTMQSKN